jgi:hypothetical protein
VRVPNAEHDLSAARGQAAAPTVFQIEGEFRKGHWSSHEGAKLIIGSVFVEVNWEKAAVSAVAGLGG